MDTRNNNEKIELLCKSTENVETVFFIENNIDTIKNYMVNKVFLPQLKSVCEGLELIYEPVERDWGESAEFHIYNPEWNFFYIRFLFHHQGMHALCVGISHIDPNNTNNKTFDILNQRFAIPCVTFPRKKFPKYHEHWRKEAMIAISNGEMAELFYTEIKNILELTKDLDM